MSGFVHAANSVVTSSGVSKPPFQIGCVVVLNSGSPKMTVEDCFVHESNNRWCCMCVWINDSREVVRCRFDCDTISINKFEKMTR